MKSRQSPSGTPAVTMSAFWDKPDIPDRPSDVRFGSLADIARRIQDVCFTLKSGHAHHRHRRPLSANSGRQIWNIGFIGQVDLLGDVLQTLEIGEALRPI
jgi:hypothetical protein